MTEFLHQIVANREYIQRDMATINSLDIPRFTSDPWADWEYVIHPSNEDLGAT